MSIGSPFQHPKLGTEKRYTQVVDYPSTSCVYRILRRTVQLKACSRLLHDIRRTVGGPARSRRAARAPCTRQGSPPACGGRHLVELAALFRGGAPIAGAARNGYQLRSLFVLVRVACCNCSGQFLALQECLFGRNASASCARRTSGRVKRKTAPPSAQFSAQMFPP